MKEISEKSFKLPNRKRWIFTFLDKQAYPLETGQARINIEIDGNEITDFVRYIHIPEEYQRDETNNKSLRNILTIICYLIIFAVLLLSFLMASKNITMFSKKAAILSFLSSFILLIIININDYMSAIATFNTSESFYTQLFSRLSSVFLSMLFISSLIGIFIGFTSKVKIKTAFEKNNFTALVGIFIGMLIMGTKALVNFFQPSLQPLWPEYKILASYFPSIATISNYLFNYILFTSIALVLATAAHTVFGKLKKRTLGLYIILPILFIISATAIIGIHKIDSIPFWLISSAIMGIVIYISYATVIHLDISIVPIITACYIVTEAIQQLIMLQGDIFIGLTVAPIIIMIISYIWFKTLNISRS